VSLSRGNVFDLQEGLKQWDGGVDSIKEKTNVGKAAAQGCRAEAIRPESLFTLTRRQIALSHSATPERVGMRFWG